MPENSRAWKCFASVSEVFGPASQHFSAIQAFAVLICVLARKPL